MWIFSKLGFFSVVDKDGDFHIRARKRADLYNLVELDRIAREGATSLPIHDSKPPADYGFRVVVGRKVWIERLAPILFGSIDYANFKTEIGATPDQRDKIPALHRIWSIMADYQDGRARETIGTIDDLYETRYPSLGAFTNRDGMLEDLDPEIPDDMLEELGAHLDEGLSLADRVDHAVGLAEEINGLDDDEPIGFRCDGDACEPVALKDLPPELTSSLHGRETAGEFRTFGSVKKGGRD